MATSVMAFFPVKMQIYAAKCTETESDQLLHRGGSKLFQSCILLKYAISGSADGRSDLSSERVKASGKTFKLVGQLCK